MMLPASKFRIKPGGEVLTKADFEEVPAWSEHCEYEDVDLIASWGIDRNWVVQQFTEMDTGGADPHFEVLTTPNILLKQRFDFSKIENAAETDEVVNDSTID